VVIFAFILFFTAGFAWRDTMDMLGFMARLPRKKNEPKSYEVAVSFRRRFGRYW
jgi:hypothetical protein